MFCIYTDSEDVSEGFSKVVDRYLLLVSV